jgi:hypothetical protein
VGQQFGGRVGLFLPVDDFEASYERMIKAGLHFVSAPRTKRSKAAVFIDLDPQHARLAEPSYDPEQG